LPKDVYYLLSHGFLERLIKEEILLYRNSSKSINLYLSKTPRNTDYLYLYKLSFTM